MPEIRVPAPLSMATSARAVLAQMSLPFRSRWAFLVLSAALILAGASWIQWHQPRSPRFENRTILVLPFRSLDGLDQDRLSDGLAGKVAAALTASNQITMWSWNSGSPSGPPLSIRRPVDEAAALAVGRQQRAGYILLGQFEQLASRTAIAVRLLRVRDGNAVWSGTYWRDPDSMTAFPSELALDIAEALREQSSEGRSIPNEHAKKSTP